MSDGKLRSQIWTAALAAALCVAGASAAGAGSPYPEPPYMIAKADLISVAITLDEDAVRDALPEGVEPVDGITGGINIYRSRNGYGLGPYSAGYVWVDIEGFDSPDGTKGRWILKAVHGPAPHVAEAQWSQYGIPTTPGSAELAFGSSFARGTAMKDGAPIAEVAVSVKAEECGPAAGALYYPSLPSEGEIIVVNEIPWAAEFCPAEPDSVESDAGAGGYFEGFAPESVTWAGVLRDASASFSRPMSAE